MKPAAHRLRKISAAAGFFLTLALLFSGCSRTSLGVTNRGQPGQPLPLAGAESHAASPIAEELRTGGSAPARARPETSEPRAMEAVLPGGRSSAQGTPPGEIPPVPVLMYHEIGDGPNELFVSEANFQSQVELLERSGYETISLDQLMDGLDGKVALPLRPVVLTFDDGYASHYETVFPILRAAGFGGVFFIYTDGVGRYNRVTWDQLREMRGQGMEIEAHSVTHTDLSRLARAPARLRRETAGSRDTLQDELQAEVRYFCYPAGRYNAQAMEAVKAAGYRAAFTTKPGQAVPGQNPFELKRVRINRSDSLERFALKLGLSLKPDGQT